MTNRTLIAFAALVAILFGTIQTPKISRAADDQPGACKNLTVATTAATSAAPAATAAATSAAPAPTQVSVGNSSATGSLSLSGGFALYVLAQAWSEEYTKTHPDVRFDIQAGGAGKGMTDVLAGAVDIAMLTR